MSPCNDQIVRSNVLTTEIYKIFSVIALPKMNKKCNFQRKQSFTQRTIMHLQYTKAEIYRIVVPQQAELPKDTRTIIHQNSEKNIRDKEIPNLSKKWIYRSAISVMKTSTQNIISSVLYLNYCFRYIKINALFVDIYHRGIYHDVEFLLIDCMSYSLFII